MLKSNLKRTKIITKTILATDLAPKVLKPIVAFVFYWRLVFYCVLLCILKSAHLIFQNVNKAPKNHYDNQDDWKELIKINWLLIFNAINSGKSQQSKL